MIPWLHVSYNNLEISEQTFLFLILFFDHHKRQIVAPNLVGGFGFVIPLGSMDKRIRQIFDNEYHKNGPIDEIGCIQGRKALWL